MLLCPWTPRPWAVIIAINFFCPFPSSLLFKDVVLLTIFRKMKYMCWYSLISITLSFFYSLCHVLKDPKNFSLHGVRAIHVAQRITTLILPFFLNLCTTAFSFLPKSLPCSKIEPLIFSASKTSFLHFFCSAYSCKIV